MDSPDRPAASDRYDLASFILPLNWFQQKKLKRCLRSIPESNLTFFSEGKAVPYCWRVFTLFAMCLLSYGLLTLSGESSGSIGRDEFISQVAQDIQNKLPTLFDMDVICKRFGTGISPTSVVLLQELERFNKLVVRMQRSLAELQRVRRRGWEQQDRCCVFMRHAVWHVFWFSCLPLGLGWWGGNEQWVGWGCSGTF